MTVLRLSAYFANSYLCTVFESAHPKWTQRTRGVPAPIVASCTARDHRMELLQYFSQDLGRRIASSLAGFKETYVDSNPLDREVSRNESNDIHVMHLVAAPGIGRSIV